MIIVAKEAGSSEHFLTFAADDGRRRTVVVSSLAGEYQADKKGAASLETSLFTQV